MTETMKSTGPKFSPVQYLRNKRIIGHNKQFTLKHPLNLKHKFCVKVLTLKDIPVLKPP